MELDLSREFALLQQQTELDKLTDKETLLQVAKDLKRHCQIRESAFDTTDKDAAVAAILAEYANSPELSYWEISVRSLDTAELREECKRLMRQAHETDLRLIQLFAN